MNPEVVDEITGKVPSITSPSRVQVLFSKAPSLEISVEQWVDLSLKEGMSVSRELLSLLQAAQAETEALEKALHFLQTRPRTQFEVDAYLERKQYTPLVRGRVQQKLCDMGLLDDTNFARLFIEQKKAQTSQTELSWKLRKYGVDAAVVETALKENYGDDTEAETALRLSQKQWRRHRDKPRADRKMKVGQYLQRKGFHATVIYSVLDKLESLGDDERTRS